MLKKLKKVFRLGFFSYFELSWRAKLWKENKIGLNQTDIYQGSFSSWKGLLVDMYTNPPVPREQTGNCAERKCAQLDYLQKSPSKLSLIWAARERDAQKYAFNGWIIWLKPSPRFLVVQREPKCCKIFSRKRQNTINILKLNLLACPFSWDIRNSSRQWQD